MPFDSCMLCACVNELNNKIIGAKTEKIYQPGKEELVFNLKHPITKESYKLLISAQPNTPRINLTDLSLQNPPVPPAFTQLLRKHLSGAKIIGISQLGFERVCKIDFEAHDDMNFKTKKSLVCEIMGKYSNIIFCDNDMNIISPIKQVDLTTSHKRQVLPGMKYELPPSQEKLDPRCISYDEFYREIERTNASPKAISNRFQGIATLTARQMEELGSDIREGFFSVMERIKNNDYLPTLIKDEQGVPCEYSFMPITVYGNEYKTCECESIGELIDRYFSEKERSERIKQKAGDLLKLINNAIARINKKLSLHQSSLDSCSDMEKYKNYGDLITANIYQIKRGDRLVRLIDYYNPDMPTVTLELDPRIDASGNAQKYYKKYNKLKKAKVELQKQIDIAKNELAYLESVFESFKRAQGEIEINEIRRELYENGYGSRMKNYQQIKIQKSVPIEYKTSNGYKILCGKNNTQNDNLTFKIASKGDYWFHAKNMPGSHVIMFCDGLEEPPAKDFTEACMIAALNSKNTADKTVEVDYSLVKNIKKPQGAKPGFVIYHTNYSATVDVDAESVEALRVK